MVYKSFYEKTGSGVSVNEQLAKELHEPVITKIKSRKVYSRFKDNIWSGDLPEITERFIKTLNAKIYKKWQLIIANLTLLIWIN